MKEYPYDKWLKVVCWPMIRAARVKSNPLKLLLVLAYFPWCTALLPVSISLLFLSLAMAVWDDVAGDRTP